MKHLFTLLILFISINISAQTELYNCGTASVRRIDPDTSEWLRNKTSFLIKIDPSKNEIIFDNNNNTIIHTYKLLETTISIDEDGDKFVMKLFAAYDQDGNRCQFVSYDYINLSARNFMILYKDYEFHYACVLSNIKKDDNTNETVNTIL